MKRKWDEHSYKVNSNGCWIWQGVKFSSGYGMFTLNYKRYIAHRYFYEKYKGPIIKNLTIDHLCHNRACVNPDHLEQVTLAINIQRASSIQTHCKRGHLLAYPNLYAWSPQRRCKICDSIRHKEWNIRKRIKENKK